MPMSARAHGGGTGPIRCCPVFGQTHGAARLWHHRPRDRRATRADAAGGRLLHAAAKRLCSSPLPDPAGLAAWCDMLVVAVPGGAATDGLVDRDVLTHLRPNGTLINIARGSVVDRDRAGRLPCARASWAPRGWMYFGMSRTRIPRSPSCRMSFFIPTTPAARSRRVVPWRNLPSTT